MNEAERQTGVRRKDIGACINGRQHTAGKHPITGEKLHWELVE